MMNAVRMDKRRQEDIMTLGFLMVAMMEPGMIYTDPQTIDLKRSED